MSGYARDAGKPLGPETILLDKPFTQQELAGAVHRALQTPARSIS